MRMGRSVRSTNWKGWGFDRRDSGKEIAMQETVLRKLTKDEIDGLSQELSRLVPALAALREEARETAADYRRKGKDIEEHMTEIASEIRTGMREEIAQLDLPRVGKDAAGR